MSKDTITVARGNFDRLPKLLSIRLALILFVSLQFSQTRAEGTWVQLSKLPPVSITDLHLLSDGTVIGRQSDDPYAQIWYRLTPDGSGSYLNGSWSAIKPSICPHSEFASQLLADGRFFVAGGEYGAADLGLPPNSACSPVTPGERDARTDSEIYDPVQNTWQSVQPPTTTLTDPTKLNGCGDGQTQMFGDMICMPSPAHR
jgi:hypothetical protein